MNTNNNNGATVATETAAVRVVGEKLAGNTLDGVLNVVVRRHTLSADSESKVAMMKRLLMTNGQTKESILLAVKAKQGGKLSAADMSTLNTVRADLKRTLGGLVVATGWRTDGMQGKLATAAVAKLRTHELGKSAFCAEVVTAEVVTLSNGTTEADTGAEGATAEGGAEGGEVATESAEVATAEESADTGAETGKKAKRGKRARK